MEQPWPMALQVAFYVAAGAIVLLAAVVVNVALRIGKQLDRVATAVERVEAELTPLTHQARVVVGQIGELSAGAQRAADAAGELLLPPVLMANRAVRIVKSGVVTFLGALLNGAPRARREGRTP